MSENKRKSKRRKSHKRRTIKNGGIKNGGIKNGVKNEGIKNGGNGKIISAFIFASTNISTQENMDPIFKEVGVIHITEAAAINAAREIVSDIGNFFGDKGFETSVYDKARNNALIRLQKMINENQKICNVRLEVSTPMPNSIFIHVYGTLLEKKAA